MKFVFRPLIFFAGILLSMTMVSCFSESGFEPYTPEMENLMLNDYIRKLESKNYNVDTTALGVFYVRIREGEGPFPEPGDTISVQYAGYLMDGNVFNTSFLNAPDSAWTYIYGETVIFPGWDEMMLLMNKSCRMEFVVPSGLAYGNQWVGGIPPYSSLIFAARMKDVRKKQP